MRNVARFTYYDDDYNPHQVIIVSSNNGKQARIDLYRDKEEESNLIISCRASHRTIDRLTFVDIPHGNLIKNAMRALASL